MSAQPLATCRLTGFDCVCAQRGAGGRVEYGRPVRAGRSVGPDVCVSSAGQRYFMVMKQSYNIRSDGMRGRVWANTPTTAFAANPREGEVGGAHGVFCDAGQLGNLITLEQQRVDSAVYLRRLLRYCAHSRIYMFNMR